MRLFVILLFLAYHVAIAQQENWKTLSTETYKIDYPADWTADRSGIMGPAFVLFTNLTDSNDTFRENVNLIIQDLPDTGITPENM